MYIYTKYQLYYISATNLIYGIVPDLPSKMLG